MSFRTTIKSLFGTAWHTNSDAIIDGMSPAADGVVEAGKPVVPDTGGVVDALDITAPKIGGVAVNATALEINRAADVSARIVAAGATLALTVAAHDGKTIHLDTAAGSICTLPVAAGTGTRIRFLVKIKPTSNAHIIKVGNASDFLAGTVNLLDVDSNAQTAYAGDGAADDTLTLNGTTTGGQVGDWIEVEDLKTLVWAIRGEAVCPAGSNVADCFSATV